MMLSNYNIKMPLVPVSNVQPAQASQAVICPTYSPVVYPLWRQHTQSFQKVAADMTVCETAMWIYNLGYSYGWPEAEKYARCFQENDISGDVLLQTAEYLQDLGIQNRYHRAVIKSAIDLFWQSANKPGSGSETWSTRNTTNCCNNTADTILESNHYCSTNQLGGITVASTTCTLDTRSDSANALSESDYRCCISSSGDITMMRPIDDPEERKRRLFLTLRPEQEDDHIKHLKAISARYNVEILPLKSKQNCYVVIFDDEESARKAKLESDAIGYKLVKYRDRAPSPSNHVEFQALTNLTVRAGKSMKQDVVCTIEKGDIVIVNQVKGRRGRIVSMNTLQPVNVGWVSLSSKTGSPLLKRLQKA